MTYKLMAALCAALIIAGCQEDLAEDLTGRQFVLQSSTGLEVLPGVTVTLGFVKDELSLYAGCNSIFGRYAIKDDVLVVREAGSTQIGCVSLRQEQDERLTAFVTSSPKLELDGDTLTLTTVSATLTFLDRELAIPDRPLVGPVWTVGSYLTKDTASSFGLKQPARIEFKSDGSLQVGTTCNVGVGTFTVSGDEITLSAVSFDEAACDDNSGIVDRFLKKLFGHARLTFEIEAQQLTLKADDDTGINAVAP